MHVELFVPEIEMQKIPFLENLCFIQNYSNQGLPHKSTVY